jgi:hypothetical protein
MSTLTILLKAEAFGRLHLVALCNQLRQRQGAEILAHDCEFWQLVRLYTDIPGGNLSKAEALIRDLAVRRVIGEI